ncbi:MAG TPA: OB-fold nucleic acid binding domain-containing protein [Chitinophagaceae bacterium]|nr:OB-fold nucleic acid binding domain-containing protein [Chitinophagaceae bacterium]
MHLSEQEIIRREKLQELTQLGIDAYPAALFPITHSSTFIKENYKGPENAADFADVSIAGRIMSVRDMGKANFCVIQDGAGRIQLYIKRDDICTGEDKTLYDIVWKKLLDIGDFIVSKDMYSQPKQAKLLYM